MSDALIRSLERAVAQGDRDKRASLASALVYGGRASLAVPIYLQLLRDYPLSAEFRQRYVAAGGYFPTIHIDAHLGPSILHSNLPVDGKKIDVVVGDGFLDSGVVRSFDEWRTYVSQNKNGVSIPSARDKAALDVAMFGFVDLASGEVHPAFRDVVNHHIEVYRAQEARWPIYGGLTYGEGTRARLDEFTLDRKVVSRNFDIPLLPLNYTILARERRDLNVEFQSEDVKQALTHLVGTPNEAIRAFQYFTKRRNNNFGEVGLWTPDQNVRQQKPERALVLGDNVYDGGFGGRFAIDCNVIDFRPACGWRLVTKNVSK